jgi:dihydroflavonol-4-reductase
MKALVTGGTGFVGSHVVRVLADAGHQVRVLHRAASKLTALADLPYESALGDVTEPEALRRACEGCDWVFHVAAVADYWRANKDWMIEVNVMGTRHVLAAAQAAGVKRVIFTSSAAAVGLRDTPLADERVPFNLPVQHFPYGYTKVQAEAIVAEAVANGQDVVTVNPVIVIGPGDLNLISGTFIVQTYQYQWLTPWTSGGAAVTDVRDVARWHLAAAEKGRTGDRYILSTQNYGYRDWFNLIADTVGVPRPIGLVYSPNLILPLMARIVDGLRAVNIQTPIDANQIRLGARNVFFDANKAHQELGTPQILMSQSVADTFRWYQENGYIQDTLFTRLIRNLGKGLGLKAKNE